MDGGCTETAASHRDEPFCHVGDRHFPDLAIFMSILDYGENHHHQLRVNGRSHGLPEDLNISLIKWFH